ncbi:hypothetical protein WJX84_005609, partial [Apatococcus fuscideae]
GLATLVEKKSRRMELAIYCMSRAVESFCLCLREWGWVSDRMVPPRLDILMFMAATGAIMHCYSDARGKHRDVFRSKYLNVLDFILGSKGFEEGSLKHGFTALKIRPAGTRKATLTPHQSLVTEQFEVRPAASRDELAQAALLRAEAYYEENTFSRFVESFKKQFAERELESLVGRTASRQAGKTPKCICMVALSPEGDQGVVGTLDLRPPAAATGVPPPSIPEGDDLAAFMTNVSVGEDSRGQGIGKALLEQSIEKAKTSWSATRIFAFVDSDNEVALGLYKRYGFREIHPNFDKLTMPRPSAGGRMIYLQCDLQ